MRYIPELLVFAKHTDWWTRTPDRKYFVPTEKAPSEAVEAIKKVNELIRKNKTA